MKKRNVLIALAIIVALAFPVTVFAATSDAPAAKSIRGFFGIDTSKLTDQQKSNVDSYTTRMAELQKEFIDQMVADGTITKAQGDAEKSRIDEAVKNGDVGSFLNGGRGFGKDKDIKGLNIDAANLTDSQKSDLKATAKKIIDLEKSYVAAAVANGLLTKDQGTTITSKLDTEAANLDSSDASKNLRAFMGGFDGFMFFGKGKNTDTTLTDQQKTDLTAFVKDLAALKKELVDKLVSDGILTSVQGESQKSLIDQMTQTLIDNGFTKGMPGNGSMKGFKGHGMRGGFEQGSNSTGKASSSSSSAAPTL